MSWSTRPRPIVSLVQRLAGMMPVGRYRVEGESMAPAVGPGQRLLVNRAAYWLGEPKAGDLVVLRDPREPGRLLLKRVEGREGDGWRVLGDNEAASTDSRSFGPVPKRLIMGKVLLRYR